MATFDWANLKESQASQVAAAGCDLPSSTTGDYVLLFVFKWEPPSGGSPTVSTPVCGGVSATSIGSVGSASAFYFPAGTSGTATFSFSPNPCSFYAVAVTVSGAKSSTPFSIVYSASQSGFTHTILSGANASYAGAAFVGMAGVTTVGAFGALFQSADDTFEAFYVNYISSSGAIYQPGGSIAVRYAVSAGDAGAHTWSSLGGGLLDPGKFPNSVLSSMGAFWVNPLQAPSAPTVLTPTLNQKSTVGATLAITYSSATDPNVDTDDLIYKIYVSDNNGLSYGSPITTTAAGILSYNWNTTGYAAGHYIVKVVANNGTDDGTPGYSGAFQLFADVVPSAPTNLSPSGYISQAARLFTWVAVNPDYDTQSHYELEWSSNNNMTSSSTTGTVTSSVSSHSFSASTDILSSTGTQYWRVRTKGAVDGTFGPWSAVQTVIVAAAPSTPTITSSSTANTANWTVTFSGIAHTSFRHRWVLSGTQIFNGIVQSSAFTFTSPFNLANGAVWDLYVSVFDPTTGLESAEAHQTLTVSYTGPATPTIDVQALADAFQISVTNSDSIDHTRIYRSLNGGDYVLISPKLLADATYLDHQIGDDIFSTYSYKARSFKPTTLGYTDSAVSTDNTIDIESLYIGVVDKLSTTANVGLKVVVPIQGSIKKRYVKKHKSVANKGRTKFITHAGQGKHAELTYNCYIPFGDTTTFPALQAIFDSNSTLHFKDHAGNSIFGKILNLPKTNSFSGINFSLTAIESEHQEEQAR